jgi:cytidylate kinase
MARRIVVAIDGPAGAGKSTIARRVADRVGFVYIDTGAMYRAVALWGLRSGVNLSDAVRLEQLARDARIEFSPGGARIYLNSQDITEAIRTPEVTSAASKVSVFPGVREAMAAEQRRIARAQSVVMEGRDIGTVVFPDADLKIFLDADPAVRAVRRTLELEQRGATLPPEEVAREIRERDQRDSTRATAPLAQAPDAVRVDTTALTIEQVEQAILKLIEERIPAGKDPVQ